MGGENKRLKKGKSKVYEIKDKDGLTKELKREDVDRKGRRERMDVLKWERKKLIERERERGRRYCNGKR